MHFSFDRKLILVMAALLAASAVSVVALTPAAGGEIRPLLQSLGIISCSLSTPCQEGNNSSTGPGLEGISAKGKGVVGQTKFNSTSSSNGQAGMLGQDLSTSGTFDTGVQGSSTRGVAVLGTSGSGPGVKGTSSTGTGVVGASSSVGVVGTSGSFLGCAAPPGAGVCGNAVSGNGVYGASTNDNGGEFHAGVGVASEGRSGVFANDDSTSGSSNFGGFFSSSRGVGVEGLSSNFVGVNAVGGFGEVDRSLPALSIVGNSAGGFGNNDLIDAGCPPGLANPCSSNLATFEVTAAGSVVAAGDVDALDLGAQGDLGTGGNAVIGGAVEVGTTAVTGRGSVNITGQYQKNSSCLVGCAVATGLSRASRYDVCNHGKPADHRGLR